MRSFLVLGVLLALSTAAHAAQRGGSTGKQWKRTVQGVVSVDMLGDRVEAPTRVMMERSGSSLFTKTLMRMPDGRIRVSPVSRGTIVREEARGGVSMMAVKYGGDSYRRQAQSELNDMLAAHGLDLGFEFGRAEGVTTNVFHPSGAVQMESVGVIGLRGLRGSLARQVAPALEQIAPGGQFELAASGLLKPVPSRR